MKNELTEKQPDEVVDLAEAIARLEKNKARIMAGAEDFSRKVRNQYFSANSENRKK